MRAARPLSFTILAFALAVFQLGCGRNSDGSKLRELERLQNEIPVFPSMVETSTNKTSKGTLAVISRSYTSDAAFDDVKQFYIAELKQRGWEYVGERSISDWGRNLGGSTVTFVSGEYRLSITYSGKHADYRWDYAVEIVWGK